LCCAGIGYLPLGFFQLWNAGATGIRDYPSHGAADRSDLLFAQRWPRRRRHLLPERPFLAFRVG
jgi:hypothetical protein